MKFLVVSLLAIFAITYVQATDQCTEERAEVCVDNLLKSILDDSEEEEVCRELRSSVDCLRDAVDECLEERDEEVEEGLKELEKLLRDNCPTEDNEVNGDGDDSEDIEKCFEENEDYIFQCISDSSEKAVGVMVEKGEVDADILTCAMYGIMAECFVERTREKCGERAATLVDEELSDIPQEVLDACKEAGEVETHVFNLLEDKRRK